MYLFVSLVILLVVSSILTIFSNWILVIVLVNLGFPRALNLLIEAVIDFLKLTIN